MGVMATGTITFSQRRVDVLRFHLGAKGCMAAQTEFPACTGFEFKLPLCKSNRTGKDDRETNQEENNNCLS